MRNVSGLEAVQRDYGSKNVKFFFVYKALAHPERVGNIGNILQPFTLDERVEHVKQAKKQLGATIPWIVDAMDNRLKHALGDRNNSEFIVDPKGKIVRKRTWSDPAQVRKDLEDLVGKSDTITKPEDLNLAKGEPIESAAAKGTVERVPRSGMTAALIRPTIDKTAGIFYAKLRVEAEETVFTDGKGKLYIGFHLDPLHGAHWNNLKEPVKWEIESPGGVKLSKKSGESAKGKVEDDLDPREFLLDVEAWPAEATFKLIVTYAACTETDCHAMKQSYTVTRQKDRDGGRATSGSSFRNMTPEAIVKKLMEADKTAQGKLTKEQLPAELRMRFDDADANKDGFLDKDEIRKLAERLSIPRKN